VSALKTILYSILYCISQLTSQRYVSVLAYHSVDENSSFYTVTPDEFARQMEYLNRSCSVVSLEDVFEFVMGRRDLPRRAVALTFDDGYYDNYVNVYPCVMKYGFPITMFVVSGNVGKEMELGGLSLRMLDWIELKEMSEKNVSFGAHTRTHPDLRSLIPSEAIEQIRASKDDIEKELGRSVDYFAYPKSRYNDAVVTLVKHCSFKGAFIGGGVVRRGDNPFLLKRVMVDRSTNFLTFRARLTIAAEWYRGLEKFGSRVIHMRFFSGFTSI